MRTASGLTLIALGAILAFAVRGHPSWLNVQVVGWVIMLTGVAGMVIPRRGYGWLRRRMVLRRGPGGAPVVSNVEEKRYPPYVMLNPGSSHVAGEPRTDDRATTREDLPIVESMRDPGPGALGEDSPPDPERLAAERQAVVDRAAAEWEAAERAAAHDPAAPQPAEEVVEQYVEE